MPSDRREREKMAYNISSGVISSGITLSTYDSMYVSNGGIAEDITVNSGGDMYISSGVFYSADIDIFQKGHIYSIRLLLQIFFYFTIQQKGHFFNPAAGYYCRKNLFIEQESPSGRQ